jgi:bacterioferritin-associated ferredoxin
MIVCHCAVVTDRDVTEAIDAGADTLAKVCMATSAGRQCGGCIFTLKALLCQHGTTTPSPATTPSAPAWEAVHAARQSPRSGIAQ